MSCTRTCDELPWYVNGTLPPAARAELERHLRECAQCRAAMQFDLRLSAHLRARSAPVLPAPEAPWQQLEAHLMAPVVQGPRSHVGSGAPPAPRRMPGSSRLLHVAVAAQTAAILLLLALLWSALRAPVPASYRTLSSPETVQAGDAPLVRVTFASEVSAAALQSIADEHGLRIAAGPYARNAYTLELGVESDADARERLAAVLASLRARDDVVLAESVAIGAQERFSPP